MRWIEHFVRPHERYHVIRTLVDDVVRVARWNAHHLNLVAAHLVIQDGRIGAIHLPELDQSRALHDAELLVLRVVPVLSLGDAWLGDVDRDLSTLRRVQNLRKAAPRIAVHRNWVRELVLRQIRKIG